MLAIYSAGDVFGELCLAGRGGRQETASAMEETTVRKLPCLQFFHCLSRDGLLEGLVKYLVRRVADQQEIIANLVTVDSEHRLAATLLHLARKLGLPDPRSLRIEQKITHEDLSEMVGTTRPRVTGFLRKFRELGLIVVSEEGFLIVKEHRLADYLLRTA